MEHNAPHPGAAFEGYYNKFDLPSGARLIIVICKVTKAQVKPNMVSFVYVPQDVSRTYQKEISVEALEIEPASSEGYAFILRIPGMGYVKWNADSVTEYALECEDFTFNAMTSSWTPWDNGWQTPEGPIVKMPLPLHWHVHSLASNCKFKLNIPTSDLPPVDTSGEAVVHQEKNWAYSFPSAHMWVQCRKEDSYFCCAGGQILGMEAFLLGYRSKDLSFDFRPPFAVRLAGLGPFMSYTTDWQNRTFQLNVQSFRRKISVKASAPEGSFYSLSAPWPEGHQENLMGQSLEARVEVRIYESDWLGPWRLVREDTFERGSLEFGGAYYPPAGSSKKFN